MVLNSLYYKGKGDWKALPEWGQFFLDLGYALAIEEDSKRRIVAGIALPTRAYAASLIAAGFVAGKLSQPARDDKAFERFQDLSTLPVGTSLVYRRDKELIKVFFDGFAENKGHRPLIRLRAGKQSYLIPPNLALQVEFPAKEFTSPSMRAKRNESKVPTFLSQFLGSNIAKVAVLQSHLDCLIIGATSFLVKEITETSFATRETGDQFTDGKLQDVLRVRRFISNASTYRSDVYYTHSKEIDVASKEIPFVVIFDGATSFLKWHSSWHHPHLVALFDQTDLNFEAAIQEFNEENIKKGVNNVVFSRDFLPPLGVPLSIYEEARK